MPLAGETVLILTPTLDVAGRPTDHGILLVPGGIDGTLLAMLGADMLAFLADCGGSSRQQVSLIRIRFARATARIHEY